LLGTEHGGAVWIGFGCLCLAGKGPGQWMRHRPNHKKLSAVSDQF